MDKGMCYCAVGDRLVFLDITRDQYFCLQDAAAARLSETIGTAGGQGAIDAMGASGMVGVDSRGPLHVCPPVPDPVHSALDRGPGQASMRDILHLFLLLLRTRRAISAGRLTLVLDAIETVKNSRRLEPIREEELGAISALVRAIDLVVRVHDNCLVRSLSIARLLGARGLACDLVFGVKLEPFAAHCWVQSGDVLLNDRPDNVRSFTPILVI